MGFNLLVITVSSQQLASPLAAILVDWFGWAEFFILTFFFGLPSLWLLMMLKRHRYFGPSELGVMSAQLVE